MVDGQRKNCGPMNPFPEHPSIQLLPEGAVFLTSSATLVVADVHLGKSAAFRAKGLPVPEGDSARDFERLLALAAKHAAQRLIVAGDLFHAPSGVTAALESAFAEFTAALGIPLVLVTGNHDAKLRKLPQGLHGFARFDLGEDLSIVHDPAHAVGGRLHVSGHWHPVVKIRDGARTSLRLPCFLYRNGTLVLPSFGSFTGGCKVAPEPGDRVFVTLREAVVELPDGLIFGK